MKLKLLHLSLLLLLVLPQLLSSCKEFIEPSINKRQVHLNAPVNQYQSTSYTLNFWWDEVEDATAYRLQIVTPKFDSIGGLILDTLVKNTKFSISMVPGIYEWHVRAENSGSQTNYSSPSSFTVVETSLTKQIIILSAPANNFLTNQSSVIFKWNGLFNATQYHFQIDSNNFANENSIVKDQVIPGQQFTFTLPRPQTYQWRVRAENDTEQSRWSAIYLVTYNTGPTAVTLIQPQSGAQVTLPVALSWNPVATASKYKLYAYKSDAKTLYNSTFPLSLTTNTYSFNIGNTGESIYWKVSAVNTAGIEGPSSDLRSFVLQ